MSRRQWSLFCGLAILVSFLTVSCSEPGKDLSSAKSSQSAIAESLNKSDAAAAKPARDAKLAKEDKEKRVEPVRPVVIPRPSTPPVPAAAPVAASQQTVASAPPAPPSIVLPAPQSDPIPVPLPPPPPEPTTKQVTIPAGTEVYIRMIDSIDTERSHPNETFRASLDRPILVDNQTIIPKRSDVYVKVIEVQSAGKLSGTSELKVQLDRIFIGKQSHSVASNTFTQTGASEGKKAARNIGIGAAVGGVLGGIFGGTKGAIIGAGAGGGGGAVISKGEQIHIDSETELMFKLENPLDVTITVAPSASTPKTTSSRFTLDSDGPARLAPPPERPASRSSSQGSSSNENDLTGNWTVTTDGSRPPSMDETWSSPWDARYPGRRSSCK